LNHFRRRADGLWCEGVPLAAIAAEVGTPVFVYSSATLRRHARVFLRPLRGVPHLACFSVKACPNLAVLRLLREEGLGFDIVSGGELQRALLAGAPPERIVFSGTGKTPRELDDALRADILLFNVESEAELEMLDAAAAARGVRARVALRVNPHVDPRTHPHVATGRRGTKFGIPWSRARAAFRRAASLPHLEVAGLDCHIGSQITSLAPFEQAARRMRELATVLESDGHRLCYLDVGGGLGVAYHRETPPDPARYVAALRRVLGSPGRVLVLEPGRVIAANAGVLLARVTLVKQAGRRHFAVLDAGMNDLLRPALYDAWHEVEPAGRPRRARRRTDVVGPVCESADFLARSRDLPVLESGDLVALRTAGAYGFSMSSNYNSRPRAAEVLVDGAAFRLVRERETVADLVRGETP